MLADDIANNNKLPLLHRRRKVHQKIAAAQKFNLAHDFALAADGLTDNLKAC